MRQLDRRGRVLGLLLVLAGCRDGAEDRPAVDDARALRERGVLAVAPGPVPTELPLLGDEGLDADGYPRRFVDGVGLRAALHGRRFEALTRWIEELQAAFEQDPRREYAAVDSVEAFGSAEEELRPLLDAWVAASPASFAPLAARGHHLRALGFARRGERALIETPEADLAAMRDAHAAARVDLEGALVLAPRSIGAHRGLLAIARAGEGEVEARLGVSLQSFPTSFLVRVSALQALQPRWGGSVEAMLRVVKEAPVDRNPRLRLLRGYVELDRAMTLDRAGRLPEALAAVEAACAIGEHWEFLMRRGYLLRRAERAEAGLPDLDRAVRLRPNHPSPRVQRAHTLRALKRYEEAGRELLAALRLEPTASGVAKLHAEIVQGLLFVATGARKEGRAQDQARVIALASELAPTDRTVQHWRVTEVEGGAPGGQTPGGIEALRAKAAAAPDDFRAQQQLDYALARAGRRTEVLPIWDAFLTRNPEHGGAHLERGGALLSLGRRDEAVLDAKRACALGVNEGCARARQFGGR